VGTDGGAKEGEEGAAGLPEHPSDRRGAHRIHQAGSPGGDAVLPEAVVEKTVSG